MLREEYQHQQDRFLEYRIDRANIPARWTLETFITTNLAYDDWYGFLGQKEMVGALLDRLRHR